MIFLAGTWFVVPIFPLSTSIGLKPDNTNAGYKPEKNTPIRNKPISPIQKLVSPNNEKLKDAGQRDG